MMDGREPGTRCVPGSRATDGPPPPPPHPETASASQRLVLSRGASNDPVLAKHHHLSH